MKVYTLVPFCSKLRQNGSRGPRLGTVAVGLLAAGCASGRGAAPQSASGPVARPEANRPAAVVDGQAIGMAELTSQLNEAAGSLILEERLLKQSLTAKCAGMGISIGSEQIRGEREQLARTLARAARVPDSESEQLIAEVRRRRGLGEVRFAELLERNAMLRALVRSGALPESDSAALQIGGEEVELAYQLRYGPRVRARMVLVGTFDEATVVAKRLAGEGERDPERFEDVASEVSIDPSRARGGLLDPISTSDPSFPAAFRRSLESLADGEVSAPIAVRWGIGAGGADRPDAQDGFAIVRVENRVQGSGPPISEVSDELAAEVRAVRERALMEKLARRLVDELAAKTTIFDRSLNWSWEQQRGASGPP